MTARPSPEPAGASPPEDALDAVFGALADPARRRLVQAITEDGPSSATSLALAFPVSRQAIVKHLQVLASAGLVEPVRDGREVRWHLRSGGLEPVTAWMAGAGAAWDRRLARLRDVVAADPQAGSSPGVPSSGAGPFSGAGPSSERVSR
jgi:DNA-binding transcriptional ArsR family regulator